MQALRYADYRALCAEHGLRPQRASWSQHYVALRTDPPFRRLTREELFAWWRDRFTDREIREMASAMDYLTKEGVR
jgi:hypothetical protein